jgi:hypothetical protein
MMRGYEERMSILEGRVVALEDSRAAGSSSADGLDERVQHLHSRLGRLEMAGGHFSGGGDAGRLSASYVSGRDG